MRHLRPVPPVSPVPLSHLERMKMEVIKIVGIALVALVIIILLKQYRPEFAIYISLLTGVLILFWLWINLQVLLIYCNH